MKQYFYGENKPGPYFEGWYFKCQTQEGKAVALIPAIHICQGGRKRASLQVITEDHVWWVEYPASKFVTSKELLRIRIGENCFSEAGLLLNVSREGLSLHGCVRFGPFRFLKSDIMGPLRWLSNVECAHSVTSMSHSLQGHLVLNGSVLDLTDGTGYIEGDRGRSFPSAYLWTQCMWSGCSLMLSIATIPFGKIGFTGCICAIVLGGREYRIATYRGAIIETWSERCAILRQGRYRLEMQLMEQNAQPLRAPSNGDMSRIVHESLCAKVRYCFWKDEVLLLDHTDSHASFEYAQS